MKKIKTYTIKKVITDLETLESQSFIIFCESPEVAEHFMEQLEEKYSESDYWNTEEASDELLIYSSTISNEEMMFQYEGETELPMFNQPIPVDVMLSHVEN